MLQSNRKCMVCGGPIARGKVHDRCKPAGAKKAPGIELRVACDELIAKCRKDLDKGVKRWTAGMGQDELYRMFPDLKD